METKLSEKSSLFCNKGGDKL